MSENLFGYQRQRGGTSDYLSVSEFYSNTQALRVIDSFCRSAVRGNCKGGNTKKGASGPVDSMPLPKRHRIQPRNCCCNYILLGRKVNIILLL